MVTALCTGTGLSVAADTIALNCRGHQLTGAPNSVGILLEDRAGVTVRNCKITGFLDGIRLVRSSDNSLITNTISGAAGVGVQLADNNTDTNLVKGNRGVAAGLDAINVSGAATGNAFVTNILEGAGVSAEDGIDFEAGATRNTVRGNRISGFADGSGIKLEPGNNDNVIAENRADNNGTGIFVSSTDNTIERNASNANDGNGIRVFGKNNIIDGNPGRQNSFNGLEVVASGNTVSRNAFDDNGFFGICVVSGNTDGGGNRATGNSDGQITFQCT